MKLFTNIYIHVEYGIPLTVIVCSHTLWVNQRKDKNTQTAKSSCNPNPNPNVT